MMRYLRYTAAMGCAVLICSTLGISGAAAEEMNPLRISGSKYMFFTITDLATRYMQNHPDPKVLVTPTDRESYLSSILDKSSEAVMSLGRLEEDEKAEAEERGVRLVEQVVGWGAVVLVVDPKNPVGELTLAQIRKIFLGEIRNWRELGGPDEPIVVMSRDESVSGTERVLRDSVLEGLPTTQDTVRLFDPDIVRAVWRRKGSIADARFTEAIRGRMKGMLKIIAIKEDENSDAVIPSLETIRNRSYPVSFPLVLYYNGAAASPQLPAFVEFCSRRGMGPYYAGGADK